jgi:hypothetical protein
LGHQHDIQLAKLGNDNIHMIAICLANVTGQKFLIWLGRADVVAEVELVVIEVEPVVVEVELVLAVSSIAFIPNKLDINDKGSYVHEST